MPNFQGLTRREFLKLISLAPIGIYSRPLSKLAQAANPSPNALAPHLSDLPSKSRTVPGGANVIIIVFDAWSQQHVSLYGYPRPTMPNLEKFAEKATVYHNHYSTGTFTVPGTSSLLTGMHPWTHRAFQLGGGIASKHIPHTLFSALSSTHSTLAYTQNKLADQILYQLEADLDEHVETWRFNLQNANPYASPIFKNDIRTAYSSLDDNLVQEGEGFDASLFFAPLYRLQTLYERKRVTDRYGDHYPRGLPHGPGLFLMDDVVDGAIDILKTIQQPTVAYLHFLPPHDPYAPTSEFFETFMDGWIPHEKPIHELSEKKISLEKLQLNQRFYDEFIASWDHETERLYQYLKDSGLMENSYIIITADHGELFERGETGHVTKLLYEPIIHVPLMVLSPGQTTRQDVHTITSSVDLLPTIAHLTGNPIPDWSEGRILPTLGGETDEGRSIFSMDAKFNSSFGPLVNYSMSLTRDQHRLTYYCYPKDRYQKFEFYDLATDPQELKDLYPSSPALSAEMKVELLQRVEDANESFRSEG